jgi:glycosyltransferase involved in cell wall biosynthesis
MSSVALALAEIAGLAYVQTITGFATLAQGLKLSRRFCRALVAQSDELARGLTRVLGVPAELIRIIPPGITEPSPPSSASAVKGMPVVGATGPSEDAAGLTVLLEAARLVLAEGHDVEFVIATREVDQPRLRHRAFTRSIAERVTVSNRALVGPRFWSVLDLYCQPSVVPSTGRTLMYALAQGIPCIVADVKGLRDLIEPGVTGVLIPPANPAALKTAVVELLENQHEAQRLGRNARESIRSRFDADVEADRLAELYHQVLGSSAGT